MGSMARMSRSARFSETVGPELLKELGLQVGKRYEVVSAGVAMSESEEVVKPYFTLREIGPAGGDEVEVTTDEILFDPEHMSDSDAIERVAAHFCHTNDEEELEKAEQKARELLRKAELLES